MHFKSIFVIQIDLYQHAKRTNDAYLRPNTGSITCEYAI